MKVYVDMRDAPPPATPWTVARAILEAIEPGAGGHCLAHTEELGHHEWHHSRLGITIDIHGRESS